MYENKEKNFNTILIAVISLFLGFFLNQSGVIFSVNFSLSDICLILITLVLIINRRYIVLKYELVYFIILSITVLLTASFILPTLITFDNSAISILANYFKLIVIFMYLLLGYNLSKIEMAENVIKWQAFSALGIALIGLILTLINIPLINEVFFFGETRLSGLMNDPNYFSVLQIVALAYFFNNNKLKKSFKFYSIALLVISVILSGSKTGTIALTVYLIIQTFKYIFRKKYSKGYLILNLILVTGLILILPFLISTVSSLLINLSEDYPSLERVSLIFTDFEAAISSDGSDRGNTWEVALNLIRLTPLTGLGVGTYSNVSNALYNDLSIAHNTYLQLFAEWGIILAGVFFVYVLFNLLKTVVLKEHSSVVNNLREAIAILLVCSVSISLNNARVFWLYLGILIHRISIDKKIETNNITNSVSSRRIYEDK